MICGLRTAAIVALLVAFGPSLALAESSIPIRQIRLPRGPFGYPIYGITLAIGATKVEAGLDTGSTGLRVLPHTLGPGDANATPILAAYAFGGGVRLTGRVGEAHLAIGDRSGTARIQLIDNVGCLAAKPECPGKGDPPDYGLEGQGIPGAGFRAIAGLRLAAPREGGIANPLAAIGARGYIVELPRRDEASGGLVIDPSADTTRGFADLPDAREVFPDAQAGTVPGCLVDTTTSLAICGTILFDTGAPGIAVTLPREPAPEWTFGTPSRLILGDGHGHALATEDFVAGPAWNTAVRFRPPDSTLARPFLVVGITPYLAFSVLYRPERLGIAVRPREPPPGGGPVGRLVGRDAK